MNQVLSSKSWRNEMAAVFSPFLLGALVFPLCAGDQGKTKTETFDSDPRWQGANNRSAREKELVAIKQDFGYCRSDNAGGQRGEIGGFVTPAGEAAYYGKVLQPKALPDPLSASGTFSCPDGAFHILLGFFNAGTINEWRTPNTIAIRLNGRGDHFYAYVEYCTSKWRAGGDTTPFPSREDLTTGRKSLIGFPSGGRVHNWTLTYDPNRNDGHGVVTATIDKETAICNLEAGHKADGIVVNRFGILNVVKSADTGGEVYFDNITVNGEAETFDEDPKWDGKNNRRTYPSLIVRPRFDFGYSPTNIAGGKSKGELGGMIFRGDCRYPERMAALGDAVGPLTLERPFKISGKIAMTRGVSDSTTLFGFYNSTESMQRNDSQKDGIPESLVGVQIEGPSSEGFCFYPVYRAKGGPGSYPPTRDFPRIYPDGASHDWSLVYDPAGPGGKGRITVSLDGRSASFDLEEGAKSSGTLLDRFGIVTTWIDGNGQNVYWDDITYTVKQ
jgi:hypothetical protein